MFPSKILAVLALALLGGVAGAAPRDDLHTAFSKFLAAKSFRATVLDVKKGVQISSMEFVAPNRYRIVTGQTEQTLIGDDAYMAVDGRRLRLPVPIPVGRIVAQFRNQSTLDQLQDDITVAAAGSDSVDGQPASVYTYTIARPSKADVRIWVSDESGLPLQLESKGAFMGVKSTTRIRYFDFDDSTIHINPPR